MLNRFLLVFFVLFIFGNVAYAGGGNSGFDLANGALCLILPMAMLFIHYGTKYKQSDILSFLLAGTGISLIAFLLALLCKLDFVYAFLQDNEGVGVVFHVSEYLKGLINNQYLGYLGALGVLMGIYESGVHCDIKDLRNKGVRNSSILTATTGVILPGSCTAFGLYLACEYVLGLSYRWEVYLCVGATMAATSVIFSTESLRRKLKSHRLENKVVPLSAVGDDVESLGLMSVCLHVVRLALEPIAGEAIESPPLWIEISKIIGLVLAYGALCWFLGRRFIKWSYEKAAKRKGPSQILMTALFLLCAFSFGAYLFGIAGIVGAFAFGFLSLSGYIDPIKKRFTFERASVYKEGGLKRISYLLAPSRRWLSAIFFVIMGTAIDFTVLISWEVWFLTGVLLVTGMPTKILSAIWVKWLMPNKPISWVLVGICMMSRGEVGLIFQSVFGTGEYAIFPELIFQSLLMAIIASTIITPIVQNWYANKYLPPEDLKPQGDEEEKKVEE